MGKLKFKEVRGPREDRKIVQVFFEDENGVEHHWDLFHELDFTEITPQIKDVFVEQDRNRELNK